MVRAWYTSVGSHKLLWWLSLTAHTSTCFARRRTQAPMHRHAVHACTQTCVEALPRTTRGSHSSSLTLVQGLAGLAAGAALPRPVAEGACHCLPATCIHSRTHIWAAPVRPRTEWCSPIVSCGTQAWKSLVPATPSPAQLGQMDSEMSLLQGQVSGPGAGQPAINEERTRPTRPSPRPSVARS